MSQEWSGVFKITFADSSPYLKIVVNLKSYITVFFVVQFNFLHMIHLHTD
jgi:hypothetical protein